MGGARARHIRQLGRLPRADRGLSRRPIPLIHIAAGRHRGFPRRPRAAHGISAPARRPVARRRRSRRLHHPQRHTPRRLGRRRSLLGQSGAHGVPRSARGRRRRALPRGSLRRWHQQYRRVSRPGTRPGDTTTPVYSDSVTGQAWVRRRAANTRITPTEANAPLRAVIERADRWLQTHRPPNPIIKWDTERWGEIPADFGRK